MDAGRDLKKIQQARIGVAAILFDHIRRGFQYAREHGYLRARRDPSTWVLHELGACLLLREWIFADKPGLVRKSLIEVALLNVLVFFLADSLYCPPAGWSFPPWGPCRDEC